MAALAGVSIGTVSKALNGRGALRPETRQRVRRAAEQLGFVASAAARNPRAGRTYTAGLIFTDGLGRSAVPLLRGAEDTLGAAGVPVFLCDARDDPAREQQHVRTLLDRGADGIIVTGSRIRARAPIGGDLPVPVVYALLGSADPRDCSVVPDEADGARRAIRHLVTGGRRRIAHITGPDHHHSAVVRAAAATGAVTAEGLRWATPTLYGHWSEAWGRQAAGILLATGADVDAVLCGNDQIARGVAETLREAGRAVPGDVALVGFGNWDAAVEACRPALTSVDLDLEGIGRTAAELLLAAMDGKPVAGRHVRPSRLVPRASTAPA